MKCKLMKQYHPRTPLRPNRRNQYMRQSLMPIPIIIIIYSQNNALALEKGAAYSIVVHTVHTYSIRTAYSIL